MTSCKGVRFSPFLKLFVSFSSLMQGGNWDSKFSELFLQREMAVPEGDASR